MYCMRKSKYFAVCYSSIIDIVHRILLITLMDRVRGVSIPLYFTCII